MPRNFFQTVLTNAFGDDIIPVGKGRRTTHGSHRTATARTVNNLLTYVGTFLCGSFLFPHVLFFRRCITISAKELHINDEIKAKEVRMLDENGTQLGIMDLESARKYAEDRDLDLVLIAPQAAPPVCRAMDYGKYCYEQDKREREARKKQQVVELKEVRLSCRIDKHDFDTKVALAKKFLSSGNKVRANLRFKGREITHPEIGAEMLERFAEACSEVGSVEKKPKLEGRTMSIFIAPSKGE